jgi:hypothetical protein
MVPGAQQAQEGRVNEVTVMMETDLKAARRFISEVETDAREPMSATERVTMILAVAKHFADVRAMGVFLETQRRR